MIEKWMDFKNDLKVAYEFRSNANAALAVFNFISTLEDRITSTSHQMHPSSLGHRYCPSLKCTKRPALFALLPWKLTHNEGKSQELTKMTALLRGHLHSYNYRVSALEQVFWIIFFSSGAQNKRSIICQPIHPYKNNFQALLDPSKSGIKKIDSIKKHNLCLNISIEYGSRVMRANADPWQTVADQRPRGQARWQRQDVSHKNTLWRHQKTLDVIYVAIGLPVPGLKGLEGLSI